MRFLRMAALLSFLHETLPALGAGNGDLAFSPGDTDHLTALGTVIITVLPILQPGEKLQEFPVLLITLIGIAGEAAENGPEHQAISQQGQQHV